MVQPARFVFLVLLFFSWSANSQKLDNKWIFFLDAYYDADPVDLVVDSNGNTYVAAI